MTGATRVDFVMTRRLLCCYGAFALVAPRLPTPKCPFRLLTGRPCPACGLTGSVSAMLRGRFRRAVSLHRLGPVVAAAVVVAALTAALDARSRPPHGESRVPAR